MTNSFYILKKTTRAATDPRGEAFPRYVNKCMCLVRNHHEAFSWSPLFFFFFCKGSNPCPISSNEIGLAELGLDKFAWQCAGLAGELRFKRPYVDSTQNWSRWTGQPGDWLSRVNGNRNDRPTGALANPHIHLIEGKTCPAALKTALLRDDISYKKQQQLVIL